MSKPTVHIKTVRGPHVEEAVPELVALLHDSDVILLEFIGTRSVAENVQAVIDSLMHNEAFVLQLEEDHTQMEAAINSFHTKLAWQLRRSGKLIILVDAIDCADEEEVKAQAPFRGLESLIDDLDVLKNNYHQEIERVLQEGYEIISSRDDVVLAQLERAMEIIPTDPFFAKQKNVEVAIVQGALHCIACKLRDKQAGLSIEECTFGDELLENSGQFKLLHMMVQAKRDNDGKPLDTKLADYFMLHLLTAMGAVPATEQNSRTIDDIDGDELHRLLEEGLSQL